MKMTEESQTSDSWKEKKEITKTIQQQKGLPTLSADLNEKATMRRHTNIRLPQMRTYFYRWLPALVTNIPTRRKSLSHNQIYFSNTLWMTLLDHKIYRILYCGNTSIVPTRFESYRCVPEHQI